MLEKYVYYSYTSSPFRPSKSNDLMQFQKYRPVPGLRSFIDAYYIIDYDAAPCGTYDIAVPAHCQPTFVLNLKDPVTCNGEGLPRHFITGPATRNSVVQLSGRHQIVGVILHGAGKLRFFDVQPSEIMNERFPLDLILGTSLDRLVSQLGETRGHRLMIHSLDTFFLYYLRRCEDTHDRLDQAIDMILQSKGLVRMDELAQTLNVSTRHLRREFKIRTGVGPKLFARLKRFCYANLLLSQHPNMGWHDLIHTVGYYDQAHLIKDFSEFAETNPTTVLEHHLAHHA